MGTKRTFHLRISEPDYDKLSYIAKEEYRSRNKQVIQWVREGIREYERLYGEIPVPEEQMYF